MTFSAALLAGGQSRRMGRDKALLSLPGYDFLWQRQLAVLEQLAPQRLYWSGFARDGLPPHLVLVPDPVPDAGPLAGICGCLDALESDLLVVLAVDLPAMSTAFLDRLRHRCTSARGVIARRDGRLEPLAAIYPKELLPLARGQLAAGRLALQEFAALGIEAGLLRVVDVAAGDDAFFQNINRPEDLAALAGT